MATTYVCFDCGGLTAAPMSVYRMIGPVNDPYRGETLVHRGGQGCHKGMSSAEVRDLIDGDDTLGPCGCTDYHMADCPLITDRGGNDYGDDPGWDD